MSLKRALRKHLNMVVFLLFFMLVFGFHWGNWLWFRINRSNLYEPAYKEQVACNIQTGGRNDCPLTEHYHISTLYWYTALTTGSGLFIFIAWGMNQRYVRHWKNLIRALLRGDFYAAFNMELLVTTKAGSTSSVGRRIPNSSVSGEGSTSGSK